MEQIPTPKKQRRFLKAIGRVAGVLVQELALGLGRKYIGKMINKIKIPKKREILSFLLLLSCTFAFAQYPATGNKQRLGYQTSGDGLVFRGRSADTVSLKPSTINNAYHLFDTVNNVLFSYIKTKGGWKFNNSDTVIINGVTMPFDSITFNTAKDGTVGVGEVEYNDTQGSLIQGLKGGNVTNVIGQQLHQRVNNRTGSTLAKGTVVYLSGSQGNRITVAKALGITDAFSANTFGIVAESILHNQSGFVITEGLITGINTSALVEDSAVYLSPTVAGGLTSTKPQAPQHTVYIGVCVKSNAGSGELFVKIRNGQELEELHNVRITSAVNNASLYYKSNESLWRDTTAALLVSDTASMLTNYTRKGTSGTVTSVSGTLPILVATGTTTPVISVADASGSASGVVNTTTQTFAGAKTFSSNAIINGSLTVNEDGSSVGVFRVEGDNNISLIQTAPASDFVGIGRVPQNALDVQGAVRLRTLTFNGVPTRIIGADATGDVNEITLGTGLSLSSGTLSSTATGTVTNVSVGSPANGLSVATGTTTPVISMALAGASTIGAVSATTQTFGGRKTFANLVGFQNAIQRPVESVTVSSASITTVSTWIVVDYAGTVTLTFPTASASTGTEFHIKTITNNAVVSQSSNVVPLAGGSANTPILSATAGKWATLVSDGTNWVIMQAN